MSTTPLRIAFDTCLISNIYELRNEATSRLSEMQVKDAKLAESLITLRQGQPLLLNLIYLDVVRREADDTKSKLTEILNEFEVISLSRFPIVLPVTFPSLEHNKRTQRYLGIGNISKKDAIVVSDAINADCRYLLTSDYKLLRNRFLINYTASTDNLQIVRPTTSLIKAVRSVK
jgi:predicted nucleic acid-binding protein